MNIILNTSTPGIEKYRKPDFTANLKGSAIRSAVTKAKDIAEVAEIREIIDNVRHLGDATTEILYFFRLFQIIFLYLLFPPFYLCFHMPHF